jgi:hypothetical protein
MRPDVRMATITLGAILLALPAGPAPAATVDTPNACLYSINGEYRNQIVTLSGVGSPAGAPAGAAATLSGASISATLPPSLPEQGYNLGIFKEGYNAIPSTVWIAIAASNASPTTQVRQLSVVASTTIVLRNGPGSDFVSGTPIVVTIPIPDTTWTVAADGPVSFSQAAAGTLPPLPIGTADKVVPVIGSIVVKPTLGTLRFVLDCQPGSTVTPFQTATPAVAAPFAALDALAAVAPPPPAPPPPPPPIAPEVLPNLSIVSPRAGVIGRRIGVAIACPPPDPAGRDEPGPSGCQGTLTMRSMITTRTSQGRRAVRIAQPRSVTIPIASRGVVTLALTPAGRHLTDALFRTLRVRVTLDPKRGSNVSRLMILDRLDGR